jgi:hypothetical protein
MHDMHIRQVRSIFVANVKPTGEALLPRPVERHWLACPAFHRVRYLSASFAPSFSFVLTCP